MKKTLKNNLKVIPIAIVAMSVIESNLQLTLFPHAKYVGQRHFKVGINAFEDLMLRIEVEPRFYIRKERLRGDLKRND